MKNPLIKTLSAIGLCSIGLASNVFADQDQNQNMDQQGYPVTGRDRQEITPPAGPRVTDGADVLITAEFIYWKPNEDGLGYATSGHSVTSANPITSRGSVFRPKTKFQPGFKVGVGVDFDHDGWDLYANYTWLSSKKFKSSVHQDAGSTTLEGLWFTTDDVIAATLVGLLSEIQTTDASADWKLRYNVFDLELGRSFFISKYLALRPHAGLEFSWQRQNYNLAASGVFTGSISAPFGLTDSMKQRFWGVGVRTGLDSTWYFSKEFSLFGNMAIAALWSQFKDDRQRIDSGALNTTEGDSAVPTTLLWNRNKFNSITPALEFKLGLRWETWFSNDNYHVALDAAWEEHVWFDMNQFFNEFEQGNHGNLTLEGLTLRARFDF